MGAAARGHQEVCVMLLRGGADAEMKCKVTVLSHMLGSTPKTYFMLSFLIRREGDFFRDYEGAEKHFSPSECTEWYDQYLSRHCEKRSCIV
jgi:hypothetical protein